MKLLIKILASVFIVLTALSSLLSYTQAASGPTILTFVDNQPTGFDFSTPMDIPPGYKSMTWKVSSDSSIVNWAPLVSFDNGKTWFEQHRFRCPTPDCPEVTIPILGDKYRFSHGTSSGNLTAVATLNKEKGAKVLLLGEDVDYTFTSEDIRPGKRTSITITAGSIFNPQNLSALSLQKYENGSYTEVERINCDGGAECPLTTLPVSKGTYRVVLEGFGSHAIVGALLRE